MLLFVQSLYPPVDGGVVSKRQLSTRKTDERTNIHTSTHPRVPAHYIRNYRTELQRGLLQGPEPRVKLFAPLSFVCCFPFRFPNITVIHRNNVLWLTFGLMETQHRNYRNQSSLVLSTPSTGGHCSGSEAVSWRVGDCKSHINSSD